jgi:hypothetical protein
VKYTHCNIFVLRKPPLANDALASDGHFHLHFPLSLLHLLQGQILLRLISGQTKVIVLSSSACQVALIYLNMVQNIK